MGSYVVGVFLFWFSLYVYVPTLPVYARTKTNDLALVGFALSMYGLWQAVVRLPLGIVGDWAGRRKPFILAGFALAGLGALWIGTAPDIEGITLGRAFTGLAAAAWVPMVVAYSSLFPPKEAVRAAAGLTLVSSVSRLVATFLNGGLNEWGGYPLAFYIAAGAAMLAILVVVPVPETRRPPLSPSWGTTGKLIKRRDVIGPTLLSTLAQYAIWASLFGFTPLLAKQLGAGNLEQSLLVTLAVAATVLGNLAVNALLRRTGERPLVVASFMLTAVGLALLWLANSLAWVFAAQVFIGLAGGTGPPLLMGLSIAHVDERERNTAMGLHQAVYAIGMFAGPWLSGILADAIGLQPMFAVTAAAVLALGVVGSRVLLLARP